MNCFGQTLGGALFGCIPEIVGAIPAPKQWSNLQAMMARQQQMPQQQALSCFRTHRHPTTDHPDKHIKRQTLDPNDVARKQIKAAVQAVENAYEVGL